MLSGELTGCADWRCCRHGDREPDDVCGGGDGRDETATTDRR